MKTLITMATVLFVSASAFAETHAEAPKAPATTAAATTEAAPAKMTKKAAHKACKMEGKKGAGLKACIKEKTA